MPRRGAAEAGRLVGGASRGSARREFPAAEVSRDPVVADALASGRALCVADGSLARVAEVVRARDAVGLISSPRAKSRRKGRSKGPGRRARGIRAAPLLGKDGAASTLGPQGTRPGAGAGLRAGPGFAVDRLDVHRRVPGRGHRRAAGRMWSLFAAQLDVNVVARRCAEGRGRRRSPTRRSRCSSTTRPGRSTSFASSARSSPGGALVVLISCRRRIDAHARRRLARLRASGAHRTGPRSGLRRAAHHDDPGGAPRPRAGRAPPLASDGGSKARRREPPRTDCTGKPALRRSKRERQWLRTTRSRHHPPDWDARRSTIAERDAGAFRPCAPSTRLQAAQGAPASPAALHDRAASAASSVRSPPSAPSTAWTSCNIGRPETAAAAIVTDRRPRPRLEGRDRGRVRRPQRAPARRLQGARAPT